MCSSSQKRAMATKATRLEAISVQDIAVQSQALLNVKDSNKVIWLKFSVQNTACYSKGFMNNFSFCLVSFQNERERVVVKRFKFEEPRIEQIQELEVGRFFE